jgi:hypothetical protein
MIRDLVLALTICAIICIAANKSPPSRLVQTDYCQVDKRIAFRHPETGQWVFGWGSGFGPCNQQDRFFNT